MSMTDQAQPPDPNAPGAGPPQPQNIPRPSRTNPSTGGQLTAMAQQAGLMPTPDQEMQTGGPDWVGQDGQPMFRAPGGSMYSYGQPPDQGDVGDTGPFAHPDETRARLGQPPQYLPRQNYVPSRLRGFGMWGDSYGPVQLAGLSPGIPAGEYMPSPMQAYGVIRGAGSQMGVWGSQGVAPFAARASGLAMQFAPLLDALSNGRFSRNFNAARMGQLKVMQEEMLLNSEMAIQRQREESRAFRSIWEEWRLGAIDDDTARQRTAALAQQTGNGVLTEILNSKDMKGVEAYLDWLDSTTNDMEAGHSSLKKSLGDRDVAAELGEGPGGGIGGMGGRRELPESAGYRPIAEQGPGQGPLTPSAGEQQGSIDDQLRKAGLTDQELQIAHQAAGGEMPSKEILKSPYWSRKIEPAMQAIRAGIDRAATAPGSTEEREKAIDQIDPGTGSLLRALTRYDLDPDKEIPMAQRARFIKLAGQVTNGRYKGHAGYQLAAKYRDANTKEGTTVYRASTLNEAMWTAWKAANNLPETAKIPKNRMAAWIAHNYSGDPEYGEIFNAMRLVAQEAVAVEYGSGIPRVTAVNQMLMDMPEYASPGQIRAQLLQDVRIAYGGIQTIRAQWKEDVGDSAAHLPFYSTATDNEMRSWLRANPYTGRVPGDAPDKILGLQKGGQVADWAAKDERYNWKPLTEKEISDGNIALNDPELKNNPDPQVQYYLQQLRKRLGIFAGEPSR